MTASGDILATYDFDGVLSDSASNADVTADDVDLNSLRSPDFNTTNGNPPESIETSAANTLNTEAGAIGASEFYSVTLTPTGDAIDYSSISFDIQANDSSATQSGKITNASVYWSVDGFSSALTTISADSRDDPAWPGPPTPSESNSPWVSSGAVDLTGAASQAGSVTFRIVIWDNGSDATTKFNLLDNVQVEGAVVPEPTSAPILGSLLGVTLLWSRRRGRKS